MHTPQTSREQSWDLPADPQGVGKCRELTRGTLHDWGISDDEVVSDVETVVSELVTNAIVHGKPPITLTLALSGRCLSGEVSNRGPFIPQQRLSEDTAEPSDEPPELKHLLDEHGRGLSIVEAYTDEWGVRPQPSGVRITRVWFLVRIRTPVIPISR